MPRSQVMPLQLAWLAEYTQTLRKEEWVRGKSSSGNGRGQERKSQGSIQIYLRSRTNTRDELYTQPVYLICGLITLINIPLATKEHAGAFLVSPTAFSIMRRDKQPEWLLVSLVQARSSLPPNIRACGVQENWRDNGRARVMEERLRRTRRETERDK